MAAELISAGRIERERLAEEVERAAADLAALSPAEVAALLDRVARHLRREETLSEKYRQIVLRRLMELKPAGTDPTAN